jgi:hypothetical protein
LREACGYDGYRMRKGLIAVLALAAAFLGIAEGGGAVPVCLRMSVSCGLPTLVPPTLGGSVSPQELPANEYVPVSWGAFGKISTRDGTHPSALREIVLDVDKDVGINSENYPTCKRSRIAALNSRAAAKACAKALVGRGEATVELGFPENTPILLSSQLFLFNAGERGGVTKLLIHAFIPIPVPTAILTLVTVSKQGSGLHTISKIPVIAEGYGSLLDFKFKFGKTYSYKGKKYGYFEAKCPDEVFKAGVNRLLFRNEARVPGVAAQTVLKGGFGVPCMPQS